MIFKLLTEHHLVFLSVKGGCRGSSESTHVKMSNCSKSHAVAHFCINGLLADDSHEMSSTVFPENQERYYNICWLMQT